MEDGTLKYVIVRDALAQRLRDAQPGDRLPTEAQLCEEYSVSRITVRRAEEELLRDGLLVRQQGRGTFVSQPPRARPIHESFADRVMGHFRQQTAAGRTVTTRVLGNTVARDQAAALSLRLSPTADLIRLDRLRYTDGVLQHVMTTWLEASRFPRVLAEDFSAGSLFAFLETVYGVVLARNDLVIRLARADDETAAALAVPVGEPLLTMASTVFDHRGRPVAHGVCSLTPASGGIAVSLRDQDRAATTPSATDDSFAAAAASSTTASALPR
ncbi:MAG: GntR family transcriptional regulator [Propionibacteriaceae bacterium]|jgi:GntR family transcriptional regulator|nr:GntR family transcriptional regulator [Propionibacteriaceae bacterium]